MRWKWCLEQHYLGPADSHRGTILLAKVPKDYWTSRPKVGSFSLYFFCSLLQGVRNVPWRDNVLGVGTELGLVGRPGCGSGLVILICVGRFSEER